MRVKISNLTARLSATVARIQGHRQPGQVVVYAALMLTMLMGLAGAGIDYGLIVAEKARLQNALDAAALAGARALITSGASTQTARNTAGETAAANFLTLHGYTTGVNGAAFTYAESASDGGAFNDTMRVNGTVALPTRFWRVIGISTTNISQSATAAAGAGMVDVMLSLDLSGSMQLAGTDDLPNLRDAVVAFINQMQITSGDPRGTQLGIARWAGIRCSWWRGYSGAPNNQGADADSNIDWGAGHGPGGSSGEYSTPCSDDATVITYLSQNKDQLIKIADGTGAGTCPTGMSGYACPLQSWLYPYTSVPVAYGTPTTAASVTSHSWNGMTGTKLSNAIKIVNGSLTGNYAWASGSPTNGRNNAMTSEGLARKVLVLMTDGFSEAGGEGIPSGYPAYSGIAAPDGWDDEAIALATTLKRGPDGTTGTADDVEIYVVGFYCNNATASSIAQSQDWCASNLAVTTPPHKCPGTPWPTTSPSPSTIDTVLRNISSSTSGTCDHYFPIQKTEDLPQLFRVMAGSIAKGRLQ
jgi:Flp pilus assembly protein TadG